MSNNPITIPKALDSNEWLAEPLVRQAFYQALRSTLVDEVGAQANVPKGLVERYLQYKLKGQLPEEGEDNDLWGFGSIDDLDRKLELTCINLRGIHFPHVDSGQKWDYQLLLAPLYCVQFEDCTFYGHSLLHDAPRQALRFARCTFHNEWWVSNTESYWTNVALFENCIFEHRVLMKGHGNGSSFLDEFEAVFENCKLRELYVSDLGLEPQLFRNSVETPSELQQLTIIDSIICRKFSIDNIKGMKSFELRSTEFEKKFAMIACDCAALVIKNTNFNGLADFYQSRFQRFLVQKSIFRDFAGFEECVLGKENNPEQKNITLKHVSFYSFLNFREAHFNQTLDLRATNRMQEPNFLDAEFSPTARAHTDRETFRIIKHSFDAVGNRIEANKYFAHEMQAYRRELKTPAGRKKPGNCRERFLLALNAAVSSHGQDYGKALAWLLAAVAINAVVLANHQYQWWLLPEPIQNGLWNITTVANGFANGFLPLRSLLGDDLQPLAFWVLIAMVTISTLTWHVLVAIRRHARR